MSASTTIIDIEQALIGSLIFDLSGYTSLKKNVTEFSSDFFTIREYKQIFDAMEKRASQGDTWDAATLSVDLRGEVSASTIASLMDWHPGVDPVRYAIQIKSEFKKRQFSKELSEIQELIRHSNGSIDKVTERLQLLISKTEVQNEKVSGVVKIEDVTPEVVTWLWDGCIPLGKIILLDGDPGLGKSTITLDIGARVSKGAPMPDGTPGIKGGVVLLSLEDGLGDTIRPRLEAAGADLSKIVALQGIPTEDGRLRFPTIEDVDAIASACRTVNAKLVIIDPLMGYLSGYVNSHRDQDVRQALGPLTRMAQELGVAVVVIRHLNKSGGNQSIYRGGGSIGIIGAARVALLVAKDPQDETKRVMAGIKNNLAPLPSSLSFHIEGVNGTSRIAWGGVSTHTADGLLAVPVSQEDRSALEEAEDFLKDMLAEGPVDSKEILKEARNAGINEKTLNRAKKVAGIKSKKTGFKKGDPWVWYIVDGQDATKMDKEKCVHLREFCPSTDDGVIEMEGELCN